MVDLSRKRGVWLFTRDRTYVPHEPSIVQSMIPDSWEADAVVHYLEVTFWLQASSPVNIEFLTPIQCYAYIRTQSVGYSGALAQPQSLLLAENMHWAPQRIEAPNADGGAENKVAQRLKLTSIGSYIVQPNQQLWIHMAREFISLPPARVNIGLEFEARAFVGLL